MATPALAREHRAVQRALKLQAVRTVLQLWTRMGADFDAGWSRIAADVQTVTAAAQVGAARIGARYVPLILDQVATDQPSAGRVNAAAFGDYAADGRPLDGLLGIAPIRAKQAVANGATTRQALQAGGRWLADTVGNELADAARGGQAVGITARPRTGWVRHVSLPCCAPCAILAGRWYRYSQGFQRHPRCDCYHIPAPETAMSELVVNPQALYEKGLIRGLTDGQRAALDNGADLNQVVNSARNTRTTVIGGQRVSITLEGTTRRGVAYRELSAGRDTDQRRRMANGRLERYQSARRPRLTPDYINEIARDREDAVRLLTANGYLL